MRTLGLITITLSLLALFMLATATYMLAEIHQPGSGAQVTLSVAILLVLVGSRGLLAGFKAWHQNAPEVDELPQP